MGGLGSRGPDGSREWAREKKEHRRWSRRAISSTGTPTLTHQVDRLAFLRSLKTVTTHSIQCRIAWSTPRCSIVGADWRAVPLPARCFFRRFFFRRFFVSELSELSKRGATSHPLQAGRAVYGQLPHGGRDARLALGLVTVLHRAVVAQGIFLFIKGYAWGLYRVKILGWADRLFFFFSSFWGGRASTIATSFRCPDWTDTHPSARPQAPGLPVRTRAIRSISLRLFLGRASFPC